MCMHDCAYLCRLRIGVCLCDCRRRHSGKKTRSTIIDLFLPVRTQLGLLLAATCCFAARSAVLIRCAYVYDHWFCPSVCLSVFLPVCLPVFLSLKQFFFVKTPQLVRTSYYLILFFPFCGNSGKRTDYFPPRLYVAALPRRLFTAKPDRIKYYQVASKNDKPNICQFRGRVCQLYFALQIIYLWQRRR